MTDLSLVAFGEFLVSLCLPVRVIPVDVDQELFKEIDQEKDGEIYLKEVVLYLRALNQDMESLEVKHLLDQYELKGMEVLDFSEFMFPQSLYCASHDHLHPGHHGAAGERGLGQSREEGVV